MEDVMPIENEYLPADKQHIDDIPEVDEDTNDNITPAEDLTIQDILSDPAYVVSLDNNRLGNIYEKLEMEVEELQSAMVEIKKTIFDNMEADSEEAGNYNCYYQERLSFPEVTLEKARDLGFVKVEEKIDNSKVKSAYKAGADMGKVEVDRIPIMRRKSKS